MEFIIDLFINLDEHLAEFVTTYGTWVYALLFAIIFAETGLVVTPFLPGDSLLFAAGAIAASGALDVRLLLLLLIVAAVAGDAVNYSIGRFIGPRVFRAEDHTGMLHKLLNREHLDKAHAFFERHGGKAIVLARFAPIIRTFVPFVAGAASMTYPAFAFYNITGGIAWVSLCVGAGYAFGNVPVVKQNFSLVALGIVAVSLIPIFVEWWRHRATAPAPSSGTGVRGVGLKRQLFSVVQRCSTRLGYPIVANWRLEKWEESQHMRELFAMLDVDAVLDVGANIGQYCEFLRLHVGYEGPVVSFEPIAELYARLQQGATRDPKWSVRRLALGEKDGEAEINVTAERTLSSLLPRNEAALRSMGYEKYLRETELARTETIPVRRLDTIFDEVVPAGSRSVFLKSDTQGFDMAVIRGARGCLPRLSAIQIELPIRPVYEGAQDYLNSLAELTSLGFEVTALFPVQRDATLRVVNIDAVMIRGDVAARLRAEKRHAPGHAGRP